MTEESKEYVRIRKRDVDFVLSELEKIKNEAKAKSKEEKRKG